MNYVFGLVKYVFKGPFKNPVAFYIYGAGILAALNAFPHLLRGDFVLTFTDYFVTRYLPPSSAVQVVKQVLIGTVVSGLKWFVNVPRV